jgi:beta-1,4-mannosyltransferase
MVTAYPRWPSPYFAQLHRHAPADLYLQFRPNLDRVGTDGPPGVVNLHRLKRLYRDPVTESAEPAAAAAMLDRLAELRRQGWRLVWTVHNLLPIDGAPPTAVDHIVSRGVLDLVDVLLCHTNADAASLRTLTAADVRVTGWAGLCGSQQPASQVIARLAAQLSDAPVGFLLLGHVTGYKDIPAVVAAFLARTHEAHLAVAGTCRDGQTAAGLRHLAATSSRLHLLLDRIPPEQAGHLYAAAHVAVCPYRVGGRFGFFANVLHPSSVATAIGFGVPVTAPELPAIEEMTRARTRWLAPAGAGLGPSLAAAEAEFAMQARTGDELRRNRADSDVSHRWHQIASVYRQVAVDLAVALASVGPARRTTTGPSPYAVGDTSGA